MSFLFKSKPATSSSSSLSENTNNDLIKQTYGGTMDAGTAATGAQSALLTGQGDVAGAQQGYNNYLQQAGYAPAMKALSTGVVGQGAAGGILNSGTTARALQSRGADLNQSFFNNYLQNLSGLSSQGLQAGGLVANAGQKSTSTGQSQGGSPSLFSQITTGIGQVGQAVGAVGTASDRRLKTDIEKIGEMPDGLGIYSYRFRAGVERVVGVMADEVEKLRPWALGAKFAGGYQTVHYGKL